MIWIDSTFAGKDFIAKITDQFRWQLEDLKRTDAIPKGWIVETSYSWFGNYCRLSKDYEFLPTTSEMMLFAAIGHLMVRRLDSELKTQ